MQPLVDEKVERKLSDINTEIAHIKYTLEKIDLTQVTDEDKSKIVEDFETAMTQTQGLLRQIYSVEFTGEQTIEYLDALIATYEEANKDINVQLLSVAADKNNKTKKFSAKQERGMAAIKERIGKMYEELTKKKAAIEQETEKFGADVLIREYEEQKSEAARSATEKIELLQSLDEFNNAINMLGATAIWDNLTTKIQELNNIVASTGENKRQLEDTIDKYRKGKARVQQLLAIREVLKLKREALLKEPPLNKWDPVADAATIAMQPSIIAINEEINNVNLEINAIDLPSLKVARDVATPKLAQIQRKIEEKEAECEAAATAVRDHVLDNRDGLPGETVYPQSIVEYVENAFYTRKEDEKPYHKLAVLTDPDAELLLTEAIKKDFKTIRKTELRIAELNYVEQERHTSKSGKGTGTRTGTGTGTRTGTGTGTGTGTKNNGNQQSKTTTKEVDLVKQMQLKLMSESEKYDQAFNYMIKGKSGFQKWNINRLNRTPKGREKIKKRYPNMIEDWEKDFTAKKAIELTHAQKKKAVQTYDSAVDRFKAQYVVEMKGHKMPEGSKEGEIITRPEDVRRATEAAVAAYENGMER